MYHDHYDTLTIDPEASQEAISAAYRRAVWTCHPDRHPGNRAALRRFHAIQEAFETLSDPKKRAVYDTDEPAEPPAVPQPRPQATRPSRDPSCDLQYDPLSVVLGTCRVRAHDVRRHQDSSDGIEIAVLASAGVVVAIVATIVLGAAGCSMLWRSLT